MVNKYEDRIRRIRIKTPWENFDNLINGWMVYATDMGSRWARVRHNGYRDMSQDTDCLAVLNAPLAWERIKRVLSYQYENGYAPRTIIDGALKDRNFSDNTVWLTFAVYDIIKELGDPKLLHEQVKFK
jgi:cellobiose phosphorylase